MDSDPQAANILSQIAVLVILTLINAFFSGSEMAVVSVDKNRIHALAEDGNKKAVLVEKLMADSTAFLSTIQVAITLAGFFSSANAATGIAQVLAVKMAELSIPYSSTIAGVIVTIILAYFNLVIGELVPKRIALQKAESFSLMCVKPIYYLSKVINPFIRLLSASTTAVLRLLGMHNEDTEKQVTEEEIRAMLESGNEADIFTDTETEMITSVFAFNDKKAKEVMVPRKEIVSIDLNDPLQDNLKTIIDSRHTKIPVYEDNIDNIIGVLSTKDLIIQAYKISFDKVDIRSLVSEPYFAPESSQADTLFKEMQRDKISMAILLDEYGGVSGMVTLEDLVEEVVGDIRDEYDDEEPEIKEISMGVYRLSGSMTMFDLNEEFDMKLESESDTLSGFLIDQLGYIPSQKDLPLTVKTDEAEFIVEKMDGKVIETVKMTENNEK